jgi:hypothetical protein
MVTKRAMLMVTKEVGKEEANDKGHTSNGDGEEDGNGKRQQ